MRGLDQIAVYWSLLAAMAIVLAAQGLRAGRRRTALNEAMHELRRPLQAVVLAIGGNDHERTPGVLGSVDLAQQALERLDREINGDPRPHRLEAVALRPLLRQAVGRWRARAQMSGGTLELRWRGSEASVWAEPEGLAQALDNLIVNAIEHGGPEIVVEGGLRGSELRVTVEDSGRATRPESRRGNPADVIARLSGKSRHGHGLQVVRRVAAQSGGRFWLRHSDAGSLAVLDLPPLRDGERRTA
ncbi:MAG TPA: HAMP domain-containing sensor histidine kinase [Solirubrobacterales bacterium]|nr:HAMP domain-containing sensor histidine kinase [Solirubrobacterales bacterium]